MCILKLLYPLPRKEFLVRVHSVKMSIFYLGAYSIIGSGFTMNLNPEWIRLTLDTPKSFDLPSESEPRFTVNPDPDLVIEYPLGGFMVSCSGLRQLSVYVLLDVKPFHCHLCLSLLFRHILQQKSWCVFFREPSYEFSQYLMVKNCLNFDEV